MREYLNSTHFPSTDTTEAENLAKQLQRLLEEDDHGNMFATLAGYQRILADNCQRDRWPTIHEKLATLFKCGRPDCISGPMIGIPVSIRDTDYFKESARLFDRDRSVGASIEWMATAWNATFADSGLWMGKTFEPVSRQTVADKTGNDKAMLAAFDASTTRIGRNFFRQPPDPNALQSIGLPALQQLWNLKDRPTDTNTTGFDAILTDENLHKERHIPYSMTGGYFLCNPGQSSVPEMSGKQVYQLNYRWPGLRPAYPMTRLIDELVRIDDGIWLGQLVFASRHYSLGTITLPDGKSLSLGEDYPHHSLLETVEHLLHLDQPGADDPYGYQNNGFFLMVDPAYARDFYADNAFPQLRPHRGEFGYHELGYDQQPVTVVVDQSDINDWQQGWKNDPELNEKFTTLLLEPSPKGEQDGDVSKLLRPGESILQMLQRISSDISAQANPEDSLRHFEKLNRLFRCGIAPCVENGLFQGHGTQGYNTRAESSETRDWYGQRSHTTGFDYYHGATLNLHFGFADSFCPEPDSVPDDEQLFPGLLDDLLHRRPPDALNIIWHSIGKQIFPWAGKSYETISGRKLSMLLDESDNLAERYPERVDELKSHLASTPHYALVKKNSRRYWSQPGRYAAHLQSGAWDKGMSDEDKAFWQQEAADHWLDGNNIQDSRILGADPLMRIVDMNYRVPDPSILALARRGPSPFARQGYIFLGVDDRQSILPMNNGPEQKKGVFQFHYRYPMIGGPAPIGFCLDEVVEIADGLYLGQLIYATALEVPFHSSTDPAAFNYQLFGYFLLMDNAWQQHRLAIGLDTHC